MPNTIELTLPYPPSANRLWRGSGRRVYLSPEYKEWKEAACYEVMMRRVGEVCGRYALVVEATRPDKRKRDCDNLLKPINDLLQFSGIVDDDSMCVDVRSHWLGEEPLTLIKVRV